MATRYTEFSRLNLPTIEQEVLAKWDAENAFEKSVSLRDGATPFVFYEGPPSANGLPGIHHVISRTLKDLVCRYKTMQGFQVKRKGGWDTHGLPIELGVEKELGITKEDIGTGKKDKDGNEVTVEYYNQKCREAVLRYKDLWDDITKKMGYWVDLDDPYITFKNEYIESLWWCLKTLYEKTDKDKRSFLYESVSIQPYSPAAGTGLSSHELNQPGCYRDVKDTSAVVMFKATENKKNEGNEILFQMKENVSNSWHSYVRYDETISENEFKKSSEEIYFLAWTTTPWTLPSNLALAVGANIDYVLIATYNQFTHLPINIILAEKLVSKYLKSEHQNMGLEFYNPVDKIIPWVILQSFKGKDIEGCRYIQLMQFQNTNQETINIQSHEIKNPKGTPDEVENTKRKELKATNSIPFERDSFKVIVGDFVTTEDGTGIVHIAPVHGADDFKISKGKNSKNEDNNIGILYLVDKRGKFLARVKDDIYLYGEEYVKEDYLTDGEKEIEFKKQKEILEAHGKVKDLKKYLSVDDRIVLKLQEENRLFKKEKYVHSYPHCWRTDKPILYYPLDAWFIRTTAVKDKMVELNKTINWKPAATGTGRFGNWLENLVDWNLSRSRFWGTPLPIWKTTVYTSPFGQKVDDLGTYDEICVGSIAELLTSTSKNGHGANGYILDLKRLSEDILLDSSPFVLAVQKCNQDIINGYKEKNKNFDQNDLIPSMSLENELELFGYNINNFRQLVKTGQFKTSDLTVNQVLFDLIATYCTKLSVDNLKEIDLHKPTVDNVIFVVERGYLFTRVPDLIDVWFDSGAMPYAQWHYPFENKAMIDAGQAFPADFIAEGVDQTRGWFYTLHALGVMLFDSVAYKTVVSNGLVLDKFGIKMSKRLGNIVDPFTTIDKYGADATRWYLVTNASPWDNLKFDLGGIEEVQRKFFGTLYNTYQFFSLYANVDGFDFSEAYIPLAERPEIDRWVLSSLNTLIQDVTTAMDDYEPTAAGRAIEEFVDEHLSNWYVRLSRRRFWKGDYEQDKICAYQTLYECMETVLKLMAPISPFFSDSMYRNLNAVTKRQTAESIHHLDFPKANENVIDKALEERMQLAQDASSLLLSIRKKMNIKVRQPLQKVLIPVLTPAMQSQLEKIEDLIKAEVNVKEVQYITDTEGFIKKKIKPNFVALGKKLGPKMKAVAGVMSNFTQHQISQLERDGEIEIELGDDKITVLVGEADISAEDIQGWSVASKNSLSVALDIQISEDLQQEGDARELVNRIQNIRKDSNFNVIDRISVQLLDSPKLKNSINRFKAYICGEILADSIEWVNDLIDGIEIEVNGVKLNISITKNTE